MSCGELAGPALSRAPQKSRMYFICPTSIRMTSCYADKRAVGGIDTCGLSIRLGLVCRQRRRCVHMESTVLVERRDSGILLIAINRPEPNNRLDPPTYVALGQALYQLEHDDQLRVGVLYATGPDFVPALDLAAYGAAAAAGTFPSATPRTDILDPLDMTPPRRSKPLVVAVQGQTKRVGHELFLAADVRVAATDTVFAQDEVHLGLYPGGGATVRLVREIGH